MTDTGEIKIPIVIEEHAGLNRIDEPVRIGLPLPVGRIEDLIGLEIESPAGELQPVQAKSLGRWRDCSVKWLLVDFWASVPSHSKSTYFLVRRNRRIFKDVTPNYGIGLTESDVRIRVDTDAAVFNVSRQDPQPFESVRVGDWDMLAENAGTLTLLDSKGRQLKAVVDAVSVEERGNLCCALLKTGRFIARGGKTFCNMKIRQFFFAGLPLVRLEVEIYNPRTALHPGGLWDLGDPGSIYFKDLSMTFAINSNPEDCEATLSYYEDPHPMDYKTNPVQSINSINRINLINPKSFLIYQDSTGGANWNSPNHVDRDNQVTTSFKGFRVFSDNKIVQEGLRANPIISIQNSKFKINSCIQHFWQNFPKALRVEDDCFSIGIFPEECQAGFELQGGEKKRHTLYLEFGDSSPETAIPCMQQPLHVYPGPEWVTQTGAVSCFVPQPDDPNDAYQQYTYNVIAGESSFFNKREIVDEYGWRNFGDLYADHEAVGHEGPDIFVSHYNNQYDFIYGAFVHCLRGGDRRWYELMCDCARHVMDIDIYHTDDDKAAYNRGLFWHSDHYRTAATGTHRTYSRRNKTGADYGGGPCNEHNYTTGLLHYHFLTGDPEARAAVLNLADWVIAMDDGSQTIFGLIDDGPTGLASQTGASDYHKPGRGAGNSINALSDAYRLTWSRRYLAKAEELIQRCIHPRDDIAELKLIEDPEVRWFYLVFLQVLGKYLDLKLEMKEMDYGFFYARDSLLHYADWMAANEVPYKDVLDRVEIPTETWPAQDIRKCHVFHLAAKYGPPHRRKQFSEKASYFFDRCLNDLLGFETAYLTRPMVILTVYGSVHSYFQKQDFSNLPFEDHHYDFGQPVDFVPQKARIKQTFYRKTKLLTREIKRLVHAKLPKWKSRLRS